MKETRGDGTMADDTVRPRRQVPAGEMVDSDGAFGHTIRVALGRIPNALAFLLRADVWSDRACAGNTKRPALCSGDNGGMGVLPPRQLDLGESVKQRAGRPALPISPSL
ncbi:hypothetical protein DPEC_G00149850 [Dallia pectoralis]|uniref:Uncharacterized protein n=1 Tax=Dallia pectoralis TaxID=75939 RepID=A0ACC2GIM3_DALPE|nr:hypothetical protein DPEC_G00149850 [Dallia pectoralis]